MQSDQLKKEIYKLTARAHEQAAEFLSTIDALNKRNPVLAVSVFNDLIKYFNDHTSVRKDNMFTIEELEKYGEI